MRTDALGAPVPSRLPRANGCVWMSGQAILIVAFAGKFASLGCVPVGRNAGPRGGTGSA